MALGKKRIVAQKSNSKNRRNIDNGGLGLGLEFIQHKKGFGRKRNLISSEIEDSIFTSPVRIKKLCDRTSVTNGQSLQLEDLPKEILVKIICGVEREDLKSLIHLSKTINEATKTAKDSHFAYTTPRKTLVFNNGVGFDVENDDDEIDAPGAPLQQRYRLSRINRNTDDSGISIALFR